MNIFQLILKQMRQRALSSWLTILSVLFGVMLATSVFVVHRTAGQVFQQEDYGFSAIVGPRGSRLALVLNSVYDIDQAQGTIQWNVYEDLFRTPNDRFASWAIPFAVGDTWKGRRIMGTSGLIVDRPEIASMAELLKQQGRELRDLARSPASPESAEALENRIQQVADLTLQRFVELDDLQTNAGELDFTIFDHLESIREDYERAISGLTQTGTAQRLLGVAAAQTVGERLMTLGNSVKPFEVGYGRKLTIAEGRAFHSMKFEGVLGAKVARELGMKIGDEFQLEHGGSAEDVHAEVWKVVGILAPTGTSFDDTIYIPLISSWAVPEHEHFMELAAEIAGTPDMDAPITKDSTTVRSGASPQPNASPKPGNAPMLPGGRVVPNLPAPDNTPRNTNATPTSPLASASNAPVEPKSADEHDHHHHEHAFMLRPDGTIKLDLEREKWRVSGIFVGTPGFYQYGNLRFNIEQKGLAMAVSPAQEMRAFFMKFLEPGTRVLSGIAILVSVLAAITILVSIYNSVVARRRDIAILRALGATRNRVLSLITLEAVLIGLVGGLLGLLGGYAMVSIGISLFGDERLPIRGLNVGWFEWAYLAGVVILAALAGLVPALAAYRVSVADNLASE